MHSNCNELIAANSQHCSNSRAASENGKRFEIVSNEDFIKIKIDKGLIAAQTEGKCDYGFYRINTGDFYFVELKGKDIETAFNQINNTIRIFGLQIVNIPQHQRYGFIVSSKVPKSGVDINIIKQRFARDFGKVLKIQNRELKYVPE